MYNKFIHMCLPNSWTNRGICLFVRRYEKCLFAWFESVKRTKQSVRVLFSDHPAQVALLSTHKLANVTGSKLTGGCRHV